MTLATIKLPMYPFIPAVCEYIQTETSINIINKVIDRRLNKAYEYHISKVLKKIPPHNQKFLWIAISIESPRCKKPLQRMNRINLILSLLKPYFKDALIPEITVASVITTHDIGITIKIGVKDEG